VPYSEHVLSRTSSTKGKIFLFSTPSHPASYPIGTGVVSPGVKRQGREADHSSPSSAEAKNVGAISPLPHMSPWHSA
jgi:hypothetical protein